AAKQRVLLKVVVNLTLAVRVLDGKREDATLGEPRRTILSGWQLLAQFRLQAADQDAALGLVRRLHTAREPLRIEQFEECREALGVAVVRRSRQEQPVLEMCGDLAKRDRPL